MKELDVMMRAKTYMDLLSQGIDPISQQRMPGDTVLGQSRLQKCFAYVSQVLQKDIDALRQVPPAAWQAPPAQPAQPVQQSAPTQQPVQQSAPIQQPVQQAAQSAAAPPPLPEGVITLTDFVRQLAASLHLTQGSILYMAVTSWLRQEGYAAYAQDGEMHWDVTEKGMAAGLLTDGRLLCRDLGQAFLREKLDTIRAWDSDQWAPLLEVLTPEVCSRVLCSEEGVNLTQLLKRVQGLLPPDLPRKVNPQFINLWLFQQGYLQETFQAEKRKWVASETGKALGIYVKSGTLYYDAQAQRFILDHLRDVALACQTMNFSE